LIERASTRGRKLAFAVVLVIGAGQLAAEAWLTSVVRPTKPGNPYAYSQTSPDVLKLCAEVEAIAKASPQKHQTIIKVIAPESGYWPLPWYLRDFENVGFWAEVPHDPNAPMMIVSAKFDANLDADKRHVMAGLFQLRPDAFFELYVSTNLWDDYLKTRPPEP
jgi:hypothetical protein